MSAEHEIGRITHRLSSPALPFERYLDLQQHLMGGLMRGAPWWKSPATLGFIFLVLVLTVGAEWLDTRGDLWLYSQRTGWELTLGPGGMALLTLGLTMLPVGVFSLWMQMRQFQAIRAIHAQSEGLFAAHELLFGETGVLWRNAHRATILPWSAFTALHRGKGQWLLVADHASTVWLADEALADGPGEAAILATIAEHTGLRPSR